MQTYKYDAFISYRHTEPDKTIADKLHRMLEAYKVPRAVVRMGSQKKVGRVFRDREELPTSSNLAESIQQALENSEHLIVICSPRTPHSQWVCKEIETFAELHGHDRILALLIEGEPEKSFPDQLRFVRKKAVREDGTETEEVRVIEPLAADIRAQSLGGMKKKPPSCPNSQLQVRRPETAAQGTQGKAGPHPFFRNFPFLLAVRLLQRLPGCPDQGAVRGDKAEV